MLDYVDDKYLVLINIGMATVLSGTLNMIADSKALFMMWIVLIYLQYGGVYTLFPGICAKVSIWIFVVIWDKVRSVRI